MTPFPPEENLGSINQVIDGRSFAYGSSPSMRG
jgi:hypothetical protein